MWWRPKLTPLPSPPTEMLGPDAFTPEMKRPAELDALADKCDAARAEAIKVGDKDHAEELAARASRYRRLARERRAGLPPFM